MTGAYIYQDNFVTPMPVNSGTFVLGTLPGGAAYNCAGKTREQILSDFKQVTGSSTTIDGGSPGQLYMYALFTTTSSGFIPTGTQLFVFFSTGSTLHEGNWCVITGTDWGWFSPNPIDPLAASFIELSLSGNRICAGPGWRYRRGNQVADGLWGADDLGFVTQPPIITTTSLLGAVGVAFSNSVTASGATPITFGASNLPLGLTISVNGVITGTPTVAGTNSVTLTASNALGVTNQSATFVIAKGVPAIGWNPAPLVYGKPLSGDQLNATSSVPGTFTYTPAAGFPLPLGTNTLTAVFHAADSANYVSPVTNTVSLVVSRDAVSLAAGETRFEVVEKTLTWHQAKADAEAIGGRLAVFPTGELHDRVIAEMRKTYGADFWLGLTDEAQEGVWRWVDGSLLTFGRWHPGEPNNLGNEDYTHVGAGIKRWNDGRIDWLMPYLLERSTTDLASLPWSDGGQVWTVDTTQAHDGVSSAKVQATDGAESYREYTVTGPAVVDFWWKVSSEQDFDFFSYAVDGALQEEISGEVGWTYRTLTLGEGEHTIRWTYSKDETGAAGEDAGWIDGFAVFPAAPTLRVRDGSALLEGVATVGFGDADAGSPAAVKTLQFANEGYVPISAQLALPEGSAFTFEDGASTYEIYLARGESVDVPVYLSTASVGNQSTQLAVTAPDSTLPPPVITFTGRIRGTPLITTWPTASSIHQGQPLSASVLTGGSSTVPGAFAWAHPAFIPAGGTNSYGVTFTPDENYYYAVSSEVPLVVSLDPAADEDSDGLSNGQEQVLGTNPYLRDTDSDGVNDLREVGDMSDPLDPGSFNSLSQGLVAYYPFKGSANDQSGNQHHGFLVGSAVTSPGLADRGESLHINGSSGSWMQV
ncbi:MAG: lectin-like protein, partial [Acidimicrobiia bacterium]